MLLPKVVGGCQCPKVVGGCRPLVGLQREEKKFLQKRRMTVSVAVVMLLLISAIADFQEEKSFNVTQNIILGAKKKKGVPAPTDDGMFSIPLRHAEGSLWGMVGGVKVGEPPLGVEVMFDTQSSNTLMFHPDITDSNDGLFDYKTLFKKNNKFYDPENSYSSYTPANHEHDYFEIEYPDGSVYGGATVTDMVFVGPMLIDPTTFAWIDYMNKAAADSKGGDFDGIVGLGSPTFRENSNLQRVTALFDSMAQTDNNDARNAPVFAFYVSKSGETGEIAYGGHNKDLLAEGEEMVYVPALSLSKVGYQSSEKRWEFPKFDDSGEDEPVQRVRIDDPDGILHHNNIRRGGRQLSEAEEVGALRGIALSSQRNQKQQHQQRKHSRHKQQQRDVVWGMEFDEITLGETKVVGPSGYALLSSTSPYGITFPSRASFDRMTNALVKYGAELTPKGEPVIACEKLESNELPILTLHVVKEDSGFPLLFTPKEYFPNVVDSGHKKNKKKKKGQSEKGMMCSSFFGVQEGDPMTKGESNDDGGLIIIRLGIPFMQKYYVEYDYGVYAARAGGMLSSSSSDEFFGSEFFRTRMPAQIGIALSKGVEVKYKSTKKKRGNVFFGRGGRG